MQGDGCRFESDLLHSAGTALKKEKKMSDEDPTQDQLDELTRQRKPSTKRELTRKAEEYILRQARIADGEEEETPKRKGSQ